MRTLVVGAGATGGYFGARLLAAGRDVTFLVRERRQAQLKAKGLQVKSPHGDLALKDPPTVSADRIGGRYDVVLLSNKAYDLEGALDAIAPAIGSDTMILPVLNGMKHLDLLAARFGGEHVLGGRCLISSTLDASGVIVQLTPAHTVSFGERAGGISSRVAAIGEEYAKAGFDAVPSAAMIQDMWEKWILLSTLAAATATMRASVGDILVAPGGEQMIQGLFGEASAIATAEGFAPRAPFLEQTRAMLMTAGSPLTASMLRDIEAGGAIEADHVVGDLIERGRRHGLVNDNSSQFVRAFSHLKAYEARRARLAKSA